MVPAAGVSDAANAAIPEILPDGTRFFREGAPRRNPVFNTIESRTTGANSFTGRQVQFGLKIAFLGDSNPFWGGRLAADRAAVAQLSIGFQETNGYRIRAVTGTKAGILRHLL
ncbi:MAG: hypothetical protein HY644_07280 [Acidobacteria bacterium]|nr:hypothetical protein [Acidobacteriota bacterium]